MKNTVLLSLILLAILLFGSCAENLDPLSRGSMNGEYALGLKSMASYDRRQLDAAERLGVPVHPL